MDAPEPAGRKDPAPEVQTNRLEPASRVGRPLPRARQLAVLCAGALLLAALLVGQDVGQAIRPQPASEVAPGQPAANNLFRPTPQQWAGFHIQPTEERPFQPAREVPHHPEVGQQGAEGRQVFGRRRPVDPLRVEIDEPPEEKAHRLEAEPAEGLEPAHPARDFGFDPEGVGDPGDEVERDHHPDRVEILPRRVGGGKRGPNVLRGDLLRVAGDLDRERNEGPEVRSDLGR